MMLGLRSCIFNVRPDQLEQARVWYTSVVEKTPYFDQPFYVGFNVAGFELGLDPNGGEPGLGGSVPYWGTPDLAADVNRLIGLGAKIRQPIQEVGGGIAVAIIADPFGNQFGLIHNPHFNRDEVR